MCGFICNVSTLPKPEGYALASTIALEQRGPDSRGSFSSVDSRVHVTHRRLEVMKGKDGAQPIVDISGRFVMVFNGEIINHSVLVKDLDRGNYESDTKILFDYIIKFGDQGLRRIKGMFSIAFFDLDKRECFLIRDQFGIKPLYFTLDSFDLCISTNASAIAKHNNHSLSKTALISYLVNQSGDSVQSPFDGITAVPPGQLLRFSWAGDALSLISTDAIDMDLENTEPSEHPLDRLIPRWVDGPHQYDIHLSGGVDSSCLLVALCKSGNPPQQALSLTFEGMPQQELVFAKDLSKRLGVDHRIIDVDIKKQFREQQQHIFLALEKPFAGGFMPFFLFPYSDEKVVVSGLGGDELFGNYGKSRVANNFYHWARHLYFTKDLGEPLTRKLRDFRYLYHPSVFSSYEIVQLLGLDSSYVQEFVTTKLFPGCLTDRKVAEFDLKNQLVSEFLHAADMLGMWFGKEVRPPLLNRELLKMEKVRFDPNLEDKFYLKNYLRTKGYPYPVNKKVGFPNPTALWANDSKNEVIDFLFNEFDGEYLNTRIVKKCHRDFRKGRFPLQKFWTIFCFLSWEYHRAEKHQDYMYLLN